MTKAEHHCGKGLRNSNWSADVKWLPSVPSITRVLTLRTSNFGSSATKAHVKSKTSVAAGSHVVVSLQQPL